MPWLRAQTTEILRYWLDHSFIPMLASLPSGKFVWCNPAFERLLGYTLPELSTKSWKEITIDLEDRVADSELAEAVARGDRSDYEFDKQYRHKNGQPVDVCIHVKRYPPMGEGDFECFLVCVRPVGADDVRWLERMRKLEEQNFQIVELLKARDPLAINVVGNGQMGNDERDQSMHGGRDVVGRGGQSGISSRDLLIAVVVLFALAVGYKLLSDNGRVEATPQAVESQQGDAE